MGGAVADPETGVLYVSSVKSCFVHSLRPGSEFDDGTDPSRPGSTVVDWMQGPGSFLGSIEGIPLLKPPYGRITAIDMNTGEHLWWVPNGNTPEAIANHPLLAGVDLPDTGQPSHATALITKSLLMFGEGRRGSARFHALDKRTGERVGTIELPASSTTAPMTFMHGEKQYLVIPIARQGHLGSLVALRLP